MTLIAGLSVTERAIRVIQAICIESRSRNRKKLHFVTIHLVKSLILERQVTLIATANCLQELLNTCKSP